MDGWDAGKKRLKRTTCLSSVCFWCSQRGYKDKGECCWLMESTRRKRCEEERTKEKEEAATKREGSCHASDDEGAVLKVKKRGMLEKQTCWPLLTPSVKLSRTQDSSTSWMSFCVCFSTTYRNHQVRTVWCAPEFISLMELVPVSNFYSFEAFHLTQVQLIRSQLLKTSDWAAAVGDSYTTR